MGYSTEEQTPKQIRSKKELFDFREVTMGLNYQTCIIVEYIFKPVVCVSLGADDEMYLCVHIQSRRENQMTSAILQNCTEKSSVTQSDHAHRVLGTHS